MRGREQLRDEEDGICIRMTRDEKMWYTSKEASIIVHHRGLIFEGAIEL